MSKTPEVRIMYSEILHKTISDDISKTKGSAALSGMTPEQCQKLTIEYRKAWEPKATAALTGMCDLFGLEFYRDVIDVNLAPWIKPISKPIIMSYFYEPDQFVDMLMHELLHVLQTDNSVVRYNDAKLHDVRAVWARLFGDEHSFKTLAHIPVHAGLKALYLDVLKEPERLERDIKVCEHRPDYKAAWEYVEKNDYHKILSQLQDAYRALS